MPIAPENRARYPKDWKAIVERVRERSGDRCEGSPAFPDCRASNGRPHPETGSRVVLTTGHLDHVPEHCDLVNLKHWCQRCHLVYDGPHHAESRAARKRAAAATQELF